MAVFVLVAKEGAGYTPPACVTPRVRGRPREQPVLPLDRGAGAPGSGHRVRRRQLLPDGRGHPRADGGVRAGHAGADFEPAGLRAARTSPTCPRRSGFCRWIEELARRGVVTGCGGANYCPIESGHTRADGSLHQRDLRLDAVRTVGTVREEATKPRSRRALACGLDGGGRGLGAAGRARSAHPQRRPHHHRRPALAGGLRRRGRAAPHQGGGGIRPRGAEAGVLARHAGGAARGAAAVPVDGDRQAGADLRQRALGSEVRVTNGHNFSYPGYNELLSGKADPRVDSNDKKPNPNVTVLEWLNGRDPYRGKVAAFCSWDVFPWIINRERSGVLVNAGLRARAVGRRSGAADAEPAPGRHHALRGGRAARLLHVRRRPRPRAAPRSRASSTWRWERRTTGRTSAVTTTTCAPPGASTTTCAGSGTRCRAWTNTAAGRRS